MAILEERLAQQTPSAPPPPPPQLRQQPEVPPSHARNGFDDREDDDGGSQGSGWGEARLEPGTAEEAWGGQWTDEIEAAETADGSSDGAVGSLGDVLGAAAQRQSQQNQGLGSQHFHLQRASAQNQSLGQPLSQQSVESDCSLLSLLSEQLESHRRRLDALAAVDAEVRPMLRLARRFLWVLVSRSKRSRDVS